MEITIDELVQVREEALKREELVKVEYTCIKEIASLKAKVAELSLKVELVERELMKSAGNVENTSTDKVKVYKSLLEENKLLKKLHHESNDLKMQAKLSSSLKECFKAKYEEAIVGYTSSEPLSDTSDSLTAAEIESLQQKLQETDNQAAEVIKEKEYIKKKVIPVLENTLKLYEKNKAECSERIEELKEELRKKIKRAETHSASPVSSKSSSTKSLQVMKTEVTKLSSKVPKTKAYMPSYLSQSKPNIKRSEKNLK
jgi:hypothetical protein